jgi:hypothetical protein
MSPWPPSNDDCLNSEVMAFAAPQQCIPPESGIGTEKSVTISDLDTTALQRKGSDWANTNVFKADPVV